jgi:phosphate uptake regulator
MRVRAAYQEQLSALRQQVGQMCELAGVAMEHATQALLQADLVLAEQVITDYDRIAAMSAHAAEEAFLQAPSGINTDRPLRATATITAPASASYRPSSCGFRTARARAPSR